MQTIFEPVPSNAPGPFYVADGCCLGCEAPEVESPGMVGRTACESSCYFKKQPTTAGELDQVIEAMIVSCTSALRYAGVDPAMFGRLREAGRADRCDALIPRDKIPPAGGAPHQRMLDLDRALDPETARRNGKTGWGTAPPE